MRRQTLPRLLTAIVALVPLASSPLFAQAAPKAATPPEVRVTLSRGSYTGILVSLAGTEVVIRQKNSAHETSYPLAVVKRIETVHHNTRNLAIVGAIVGVVVALSSDLCDTGKPYVASSTAGEPDCITPAPLLITGSMAGLGAIIGGALDNERRRVLYPTSSQRPALRVAPLAVRRGAGAIVTVRW